MDLCLSFIIHAYCLNIVLCMCLNTRFQFHLIIGSWLILLVCVTVICCVSIIFDLVSPLQGAGIGLRPYLSDLVCCMLESLSSLEDQGLNYVEVCATVALGKKSCFSCLLNYWSTFLSSSSCMQQMLEYRRRSLRIYEFQLQKALPCGKLLTYA